MAIKVLRKNWGSGAIWIDLSDCWTYNGKPVRFRFRRIPESPPHITTWSIILGPISVKLGWLNNTEPGE